MECNRDEALRAKEIAERKFTTKDIKGAKKFALKAQNLYPSLEGISQMLATFDVYLSAENKIKGETDWYAILSVNASADDETVKKQYRKLALILHPDKNKAIGAEGAFKLLSEAWSVLSDKGRRLQYDQKTVRGNLRRASQQSRDASAATSNGFYNFANSTNSRAHKATTTHSTSSAPPPPQPSSAQPSSSRPPKQNTFWTACNRCKMQYEYLRVYLNHNLLCPNCHEPFLALEIGHPTNGTQHSTPWPSSHQQGSHHSAPNKTSFPAGKTGSATGPNAGNSGYGHAGVDSYNNINFQWGPFSRSAGVASATASSSAAVHAANMVHHTYEKVRKEREEAQAAARREEARRKINSSKRGYSVSFEGNASGNPPTNVADISRVDRFMKKRKGADDNGGAEYGVCNAEQGFGVKKVGPDAERPNGFSRGTTRYGLNRELTTQELRGMLLEKSKKALGKKLAEVNIEKEKARENAIQEKSKVKDACAAKLKVSDQEKFATHIDEPKEGATEKDGPADSSVHSDSDGAEPVSITYPDPDFHDFDMDRSEKCFEPNQVWAAYDDDDGMPRFYALIQKIVSLKPFKLRYSWLNSKTNNELGPLNWVASGFAKTCGEFRVGRYEDCNSVNIFSHKVSYEKGVRGVLKVFPRKADVWAIYRNWSSDWNENTPDDVIHKYDMVEVLEDYNEQGVLVTPLVKVAGFKTVFHRHMDPKEMKQIPREEMFRFSHQVPSWLLTGEEGGTAPKGCRELDPASTPLELLQVITDTKEEDEVGVSREQVPAS
ncbi:hypothetical protein H6P81_012004 [Aristolochia fimbriata]|uniref:J domain-containing protein n=1 Tax=Aristolochia fimbriata TaxID=158543 RepID=A0AAV7EDP2_ARIFI|nr:hypothetical protein H6P81_012004 [Aristolochia fimbriata]